MIWLHMTSDLFIWMAYVSIPLILLYFTQRRNLPFQRIFLLFALFILACGTTHLVDALMFYFPYYRLSGFVKFTTAVVSWVTVIALVPVIPRVMTLVSEASKPGADTRQHKPLKSDDSNRIRDYIIAVLMSALALLIRAAIDPAVYDDHVFVIPLLAVMYVSWQCGFGPAILCLTITGMAHSYFFMQPRWSFLSPDLKGQLTLTLFFFCGVACAALGESQRISQRRAKNSLATAIGRQAELESEVIRRRVVEAALRQRETELIAAQRESAETLARLNAFLDNAPFGIAFFDPELRIVRMNSYLAETEGLSNAYHRGKPLTEVIPDLPEVLLTAYQHAAGPAGTPFTRQIARSTAGKPGMERIWQVTGFPILVDPDQTLGAGVFLQDETNRIRAEEELRRSERNLSDFFENANIGLQWLSKGGVILRANRAELEMLGYTREEYVGKHLSSFHVEPHTATDILDRLIQGERLDNYPAKLRCKDGTIRDVLIAASGMWEEDEFIHSRCFIRDVTDLTRAADALRESEARFRSMADSVPAMIWLSDLDGRRTYFNKTWLEFTGRTAAQESDFGWTEDIHPDDRERYLEAYMKAFDRVEQFELEYLLRRRDGAYRWVMARGTPLRTPAGIFTGFVGLCLDVTDRHEAAQALVESEAFRRSVFENTPDCVMILDLQGQIVEINSSGMQIFEIDDSSMMLNTAWIDLWPVANRETISETVAMSAEGGTTRFQGFCPTLKGTAKFWDVSVAALPGSDGKPYRIITVSRDITEQRRAQDAVRASELRFRTLTEAIPQMVWTTDATGKPTFFNKRWYQYTGSPFGVAQAEEWMHSAIHPDDVDTFVDEWQTAIRAGDAPFINELRLCRHEDSAYRWMLAVAVPLQDITGQVVEWVGTLTDIDDQKRHSQILEELVRARTSELVRSNEELEQFAYIASHDLQEPLRKIQAFGDRLQTRFRNDLPESGREYVDRMLNASARMRRLIDDLLTFSRVSTQPRKFVAVDLASVAEEVVSDLEERLQQTDGTIKVDPLPTIDADPTQMRQLFQNLLVNAVKFHRPGVPPVVEVRCETLDSPDNSAAAAEHIPMFRISVKDNGIGFDEKYRDRIFDVFQRLHGRDEYEGTGVGLAICRKIAERHGGSITSYSRSGEGSTFVVVLPGRQSHVLKATASHVQQAQAYNNTDRR